MAPHNESHTTLTLEDVMALRPSDDPSWIETFAYIEAEHYGNFPDYWDLFLADIRIRGIVTPIIVTDSTVFSGHHRVWAAQKLGIDTIPAVVTDRPGPWLWVQAQRESDWEDSA